MMSYFKKQLSYLVFLVLLLHITPQSARAANAARATHAISSLSETTLQTMKTAIKKRLAGQPASKAQCLECFNKLIEARGAAPDIAKADSFRVHNITHVQKDGASHYQFTNVIGEPFEELLPVQDNVIAVPSTQYMFQHVDNEAVATLTIANRKLYFTYNPPEQSAWQGFSAAVSRTRE